MSSPTDQSMRDFENWNVQVCGEYRHYGMEEYRRHGMVEHMLNAYSLFLQCISKHECKWLELESPMVVMPSYLTIWCFLDSSGGKRLN